MADQDQGGYRGPGRYRHFKGGHYRVLGLGSHSESGERLVIYEAETDGEIYARPRKLFDHPTEAGEPRFVRVDELAAAG
jgi:hypothetical protein